MYKIIKKILTTRDAVLVKDENEVFYKIKMSDDNKELLIYEGYEEENEIKYAKESSMVETSFGHIEEDRFNDYADWKIIEVFDIPKERFKVGDEVVVTEGYRKGEIGKVYSDEGISYEVDFGNNIVWYEQNQLSYPFTKPKEESLTLWEFVKGRIINSNLEVDIRHLKDIIKQAEIDYKLKEIK